ncbi:MAG: SMP-30/gluconolactonase/LRE family protein [Deltaproteobacteria bacterium]|nr:SMP-30/gluconolactonase/LRE family protein [Deltaproteobacteria bacterium]
MWNRRYAIFAFVVPLGFAYACSSDPTDPAPTPEGDDSGTGTDGTSQTDSNNPLPDGSPPPTDGSVTDTGTDAGITCVGNPLTADGGTPDGGANPEAGLRSLSITYPFVVAASFLDGPQYIDSDGGALVFTQITSDPPRLLRVGPDGGAATSIRTGPVGQGELPIGNAVRNNVIYTVVADNGTGNGGSIWQTRPNGDAGPTLLAAPSTNPNDLAITANGTIFFTDPQYQTNPAGTTAVYRMAPDGGVSQVQNNLPRPNGIALSRDGTQLFVGLGPLGGENPNTTKGVLVYTVSAAGVATAPGTAFLTAADLADTPDGLAVDVGGNLWVAEAAADGSSQGRVEVFSSAKKKLGTLSFPTERPTGIAFGGADDKTVYITTETNVWVYPSRCAGVR